MVFIAHEMVRAEQFVSSESWIRRLVIAYEMVRANLFVLRMPEC